MYPFVTRILSKPLKTKHPINAVIPSCPCTDSLCPYPKPTEFDTTPRGITNWKLYCKNRGIETEVKHEESIIVSPPNLQTI